jgi:APA family basic amino acid/polyamine antiporter
MSTLATPHEGPSAGEPAPAFQQKLGPFDAVMLVAGTMIGSGIFIVSADIARDVGSAGWLMAIWILTGVMTVMGALCYAELAAMMPHAGGQYVYLREAYSPLWGFLYGWTLFTVIQTGSIAAVGVAFAKFLGVLVPGLGTDTILYEHPLELKLYLPGVADPIFERESFKISMGQIVAVFIVGLLTLLNCRGVREGKWVQNIFTVAKTLALILLIVVGLTIAANPEAIKQNTADWWGGAYHTVSFAKLDRRIAGVPSLMLVLMVAGGAMVGSLFSSDAWNNVTFTAGEVKNPRRTLPISLTVGTGMVIVLYLLANLAYLAVLPMQGNPALAMELEALKERVDTRSRNPSSTEEARARLNEQRATVESMYRESTFELGINHARDDRVGTAALQLASPNFGVPFMAIAIMISTFGCVNGMILMGARLYYAMARDGLFFQGAGQLNSRGVPAMGLLLQGAWSIVLIFSGTYSELLDYVIFAALLFYVVTVIGLFILRRTRPDAERPYRVIGYPVLPAVYVMLCTLIMVDLLIVKPVYTWPGLILVLTGIPVYFFWRLIGPRTEVAAAKD